ncbi:alpha/beta hydrolase [Tamlana sp. s12]|uniref:alpha/beta fold hydrolase n=1 Tax=Tamlana sp. s12 TaxID=1630406 RepID=UPI0007FFEA62|nr:alpha/beta hydrolase [Tamlana sp. s12]OBQ54691.1 alpha/beta hydrolase [Tamlana sp. s12]QQY82188.1 alpha/beta hydrolase [Tamlana sp. s12]
MSKHLIQIFFLLVIIGCGTPKKAPYDNYVFQTLKQKNNYIQAYNQALQLWDIPYSEEDIQTKYGKAHVIISGKENNKALVLLHGMDASSTMWYPNIKALSKTHRIYAIDFLMEPGKSTLTTEALSKEEIVDWYQSIFSHYQLKNFDIVAASRGGWMATLLATQENNSIDKIALLSPAQTFEYVDAPAKTSKALFLKLFPSKNQFKKTLDVFSKYPNKINSVYKNQFYLANKYAKSNTSLLQMQPFSEDELKSISNPVLVLIGDQDVINSEEALEKAKDNLENSTTRVIKDAGHFLSIDQSEIVNKTITEFLNP